MGGGVSLAGLGRYVGYGVGYMCFVPDVNCIGCEVVGPSAIPE